MGNNLRNIAPVLRNKVKYFRIFFVIFYLVGIAGISFPASSSLFLKLVPLALLLSFAALLLLHPYSFELKTILIFGAIYLGGFIVEAVGVNTGLIFGHYQYGESLGPKIFHTPLMIGINWLLLVYLTSSVLETWDFSPVIKIVVASGMMLIYDMVLEQLAPGMDMWAWAGNQVPLQNYLAWFILAIIFHSFIKAAKINTQNPLAWVLLCCQFFFFLILYFISL